ncbi:MAG: hypothetical protein CMD98_01375 [Gammaproteobacteria bacterium]|nr:hypothetical protein [Gammaproteobacteria bacterium]
MNRRQSIILTLLFGFLLHSCSEHSSQINSKNAEIERIGVLFISHGGNEVFNENGIWDVTVQIFSYDKNSPIYQRILWNEDYWPQLLKFESAQKSLGKYGFEYERIGGVDPYPELRRKVTKALTKELNSREQDINVDFVVDNMTWISPDIRELPDPRMLYNPGTVNGSILNYCHEDWKDCDPDRYDIDGPVTRLLNVGIDKLIMIDLTTAGARFSKTYDTYLVAKKLIKNHNELHNDSVVLEWVNDPKFAMDASYPVDDVMWTRSMGTPTNNPTIDIELYPNPVIEDKRLAAIHMNGIGKKLNPDISLDKTGILLLNHGINPGNEAYDPKINDTLKLNENIKTLLLEEYPSLHSENILGGWFGDLVINEKIKGPPNVTQRERSRPMRGENLGYINLHDSSSKPIGVWGHRYWEALEILRNNGVEHIVMAFPQIMEDSVLNLIEVPNQMAKEIGYQGWMKFNGYDYDTYPKVGHPFAEYWGIWVKTMCKSLDDPQKLEPCCYKMGGCDTTQPYPPLRQALSSEKRTDMDPSLAYDVSAYGHQGYDPNLGSPSNEFPVQDQYPGTWSMWDVNKDHDLIAEFLADKVIQHIKSK